MALITLAVQHAHTFDEACTRVETTVHACTSRFGTLVRRVAWSTDRSQVRLEGIGSWMAIHVDAHAVQVSAAIPLLGRRLGGSVIPGLQEMLQRTVQPTLPRGPGKGSAVPGKCEAERVALKIHQ